MAELFAEYGLFLAKVITVVVALLIVIGSVVSLSGKAPRNERGRLKVTPMHKRHKETEEELATAMLDPGAQKILIKEQKKQHKAENKANKKAQKKKKSAGDLAVVESAEPAKKRYFVLDFDGDVRASQVEFLRKEISSVLGQAKACDEVVVRLESPGGVVHGYGLAASQLSRIKEHGIPLTVCVDKVAASGGYMMACIADKIVAAPFAIIGSIGVVAQIPNFNRLLRANNIDFELHTAGDFKRTITMFGENTDEGREKFVEELEDTHELFKEFVSQNRPVVDIERVATGEHWFATRSKQYNLIDEIMTSDQYLLNAMVDHEVYGIHYEEKKSLADKIGFSLQKGVVSAFEKVWQQGISRFIH